MKARRLQGVDCRFETSDATFEGPKMKKMWQLLNVFIMVGFMGKF